MDNGHLGPATRYQPTPDQVQALIREAAKSPLGTEFLTEGALDAVAATFGVHAFTVDAAREALHGVQGAPATGPSAPVATAAGLAR
ncbi:MAG: hypothetical protein ACYTGG_05445 [Planctomycetota bacterium]